MKKDTKDIKPVHKIRQGAITASIWRQDTGKGALFNVTFQRTYRNGDDWKYTASFGQKDLLVVGLIAARAFEWIGNQPKKRVKQPEADSPTPGDDVPF